MSGLRWKNRLVLSTGILALLGIGYVLGQQGVGQLAAEPIKQAVAIEKAPPVIEENKRVIAYIYGNTPLSREEFGEYLIQRLGQERIELFVNKKIIEHVAASKGIEITQVEIDAVIEEDCNLLNIKKSDFITSVLKRYGKSMYEWKEDVIKPRLMMAAMVRDKIQVAEGDLKKMFENRYGQKVKAQVIIWPKSDGSYLKNAQRQYDELRKGDNEFNAVARIQADSYLASKEGHVEPIARWSPTGDNTIEDMAFSLKPGQISRILDTPVGAVVIKCNGLTEVQSKIEFDKVKADLLKEVIDQKIAQEVPKLCEILKTEAKPIYVLQPLKLKATDVEKEIQREIEPTGFKDSPMQKK